MNEYKSYQVVEQKITHSGLFKLNKASAPIGIIELTAKDKSLSKIGRIAGDYKPHIMRIMIGDFAAEITSFSYGPRNYNSLQNVMNNFETEFISFLDGWNFRPVDLNPHFDALVKKAKKRIKGNMSQFEKKITRFDRISTLRRNQLIVMIHDIFQEYTEINTDNILYYTTHLLIACGIESDSHQAAFKKIKRAYYRYRLQE